MFSRHILILILLLAFCPGFSAQRTGLFDLRRDKEPKTWEELTDKLTTGISDDSVKVITVYRWITENISYDYRSFMSGQPIRHQSPERVYLRRSTTCTGYANLMVSMLNRCGIEAVDVEGFTHDFTLGIDSTKLSSDHAWVAFKCNGQWLLADPTWDAGYTGIYVFMKETRTKTPFFRWVKRFRFKYLFRKGKQNPRFRISRTYTYKEGFLRNPQQNYIFIPAETFLKTHLPNVAHFQFMKDPVTVEQFCDSAHSLGALHYDNKGYFNFTAPTDSYSALEYKERLLWLADSSLLYHYLNHGDKAINTHNYLANFCGERSTTEGILERFISLADTVILHAPLAIRINRQELMKKRKEFSTAFNLERTQYNAQMLQLTRMKGHLSRTNDIYRKGLDRIRSKELTSLAKIESKVPLGRPVNTNDTLWYPKNEAHRSELRRIRILYDSLRLLQQEELKKFSDPSQLFDSLVLSSLQAIDTHFSVLGEGVFLNQWKVRWSDEQLTKCLTRLNRHVADSINTVLGPRSSWVYMMKLDRELKRQRQLWLEWEKKDTSFHAAKANEYCYALLSERSREERVIIEKRMQTYTDLQKRISGQFLPQLRNLNTAYSQLNRLRILRQNYLNKMMNNKYKRSILVYQSILTNAKNWKKNYQSRLKMLRSNS